MKKLLKRAIATIILITAAVAFPSTAHAVKTDRGKNMTFAAIKNPAITTILKVKDGKLANDKGEVVLSGINLGGWLLMESWMSPVEDENEEMAYSDIIDILTNRFGKFKAHQLVGLYENNFITEADFTNIARLGFNCVRIPFWYGNFMTSDGEWLTYDTDDNPGFRRLDFALRLCDKYNLYAILDMHGCPGGQSMNHSTGTIGKNELYTDEKNLAAMERLWAEIAKRYKNNVCVAAYDIMNEPFNNAGYDSPQAESPEAVSDTISVYDRMIKVIRKIDSEHIISVEGIWTTDILPDPKTYGWRNMIYQMHIYDRNKPMISRRITELTEAVRKYNVAPLIGEYNNSPFEAFATEEYSKNNISRIKWTYKTVGTDLGNWGLYNKAMDKTDIKSASFAEIKAAFGAEMQTDNGFVFNEEEYMNIR